MRWLGGRESGNIEDRRGLGPAGIGGGVGVIGIVIALVGYFVFGVDPRQILGAMDQTAPASQQEGVHGKVSDEGGRFVDVVETSTTDVWTKIFAAKGGTYERPAAIVLYDQATGTGCGMGQSAMGPFYCPADQKVYLDLAFWNELESRFGAKGEFARAYVIAHEIGHHVQQLAGTSERAQRMGAQGATSGSVRLELQADCYAGVWAAHAGEASSGAIAIDAADIRSGLGAAAAVGDDAIQRQQSGQVIPDSFTHGTSEQRMRWFDRGLKGADPDVCDTFGASSL